MKNKLIAALCTLLLFISAPSFALSQFKNDSVIWQSETNVYFKYAAQDKGRTSSNDHPAKLREKEISTALGQLAIQSDKKTKPLFSEKQIDLLAQHLVTGLSNAAPDQDVTFALQKNKKRITGLGLSPDKLFVAGRAFYKDNKLNIIVGDYDRPRDIGFEAAYDPTHVGIVRYSFDHGSRKQKAKQFKVKLAKTSGVETKSSQLNNWLIIDLKVATKALAAQEKKQKQQAYEAKRDEIRAILASDGIIPAQPITSTTPVISTPTPEKRLTTLKNLKDKGLITNKEYADKRAQILDDI